MSETDWLRNTTPQEVVNLLKERDRKINTLESEVARLKREVGERDKLGSAVCDSLEKAFKDRDRWHTLAGKMFVKLEIHHAHELNRIYHQKKSCETCGILAAYRAEEGKGEKIK